MRTLGTYKSIGAMSLSKTFIKEREILIMSYAGCLLNNFLRLPFLRALKAVLGKRYN